MRLLKRQFSSDNSGKVSCVPEEAEDLWSLYNLIAEGDRVSAIGFRCGFV